MVLTFPHMGNIYIPLKAIFEDLSVPLVIPPFCSKKTLDLGTGIAPETICLPLKLNLGNYIESRRLGADTFMLTGSCGPCRFGYYGVSEREILNGSGYTVDMVVLDIENGIDGLIKRLKKISNGANLLKGVCVIKKAFSVCAMVDRLEKKVFYMRSAENNKGETDAIYTDFRKNILLKHGSKEILEMISKTSKKLDNIDRHKNLRPLKIGIVGEIYTVIEPYANMNIERKLGAMGILADRSLTASGWIKNKFYRIFGGYAQKEIYKLAKPYIDRCIGGHAQECIGHTVRYAKSGYDRVIEVLPFGCMPEIVSGCILPQVSKDFNLPVLSLTVDEMTGETGFNTRLEAFLDLLAYKKTGRFL